ncbi:ferritin-like domain-containing protein [Chromobacterium violaceum]|uniref:ferritin-like domain-containing protein n=1 Tax=Chromobacterium violaceum TaxID=536 RepID=UPI00143D12A4|nr:ferritin-like domain-containing protein [Chromobacterium violaceum]QIY77858.1 hypothetical protein FOB43_00945 [Chromobacterium violaceum]
MSVSHRKPLQQMTQDTHSPAPWRPEDADRAARLPLLLQQTLRREHSLIPPLLAAWLSLKPATNRALAGLLQEAIASQLRRMALAANLQIAIGGRPRAALPGFVPAYPATPPLMPPHSPPMGIERFSPRLLRDTLLPQIALGSAGDAGIAGFYLAMRREFEPLDRQRGFDTAKRQLLEHVPGAPLPVIRDTDSALAALDELASHDTPLRNGLAAFAASDSPTGFAPDGVWAMPANARIDDHAPGSPERSLLERFAACYADFLRGLDAAFGGSPVAMAGAMDLIFDLKLLAAGLMNPAVSVAPDGHAPCPPLGLCFSRATAIGAATA